MDDLTGDVLTKPLKLYSLILVLILVATVADAATYYLTSSGKDNAQIAKSWNTQPDGSGTQATNFTTNGDIFIVPAGIQGSVSGSWTLGSNLQVRNLTLTIEGSLTIRPGFVLTLTQRSADPSHGAANVTVAPGGNLIFADGSLHQVVGTGNPAWLSITFREGSTLTTAQAGGIIQSVDATQISLALHPGANYTFNGESDAQSTAGLPSTVNNLSFSGAGSKFLSYETTHITGSLIISRTGSKQVTVYASNDLTISRNLTIGNGTAFSAGPYVHHIGGNWTNNGTLLSGPGTITFNGTTPQTLSGESPFFNVTIPNPAGVTATANQSVAGNLYLAANNPSATRGLLDMDSYILDMGISGTVTDGPGDVTGTIRRVGTFEAGTPYNFGHYWTRINFNSGPPSEISVRISIGSAWSWLSPAPVLRKYEILQSGGSGDAMMSFHYLPPEINGNDPARLVVWENLNGKLTEYPRATLHSQYVSFGPVDFSRYPSSFGEGIISQVTLANTQKPLYIWKGSQSQDWKDSRNWASSQVPDKNSAVVIPNASKYVQVPRLPAGTSEMQTLTLDEGGVLEAAAGSELVIHGATGAWEGYGTFSPGSDNTVTFVNAAAAFAGQGNFNHLRIAQGAKLTNRIGSVMRISGNVFNEGIWEAGNTENTVEYTGSGQTIINPNGTILSGYHNLTFRASGNIELPAPVEVRGDFANHSQGLVLGGEVKFIFRDHSQVIGGTHPTTFTHLTADGGIYGLVLEQDVTVTGNMNLVSGILSTGTSKITLGAAATLQGNFDDTRYIDGRLARVYNNTASRLFPVGNQGNYRPVSVKFSVISGSATITASQSETLIPGNLPVATSVYGFRHWEVTHEGSSLNAWYITLDGTGFVPVHLQAVKMLKSRDDSVTSHPLKISGSSYTNQTAFKESGKFALGEDYLVWSGTTSDWTNPGNWQPAYTPTARSNLSIPVVPEGKHYPVIDKPETGPALCNHLITAEGAGISIVAGGTLSVNGDLSNQGSLVIDSDETSLSGSLIIHGTATGIITYQRYMRGNRRQLVSSPVSGQRMDNLVRDPANAISSPATNKYDLTEYWEPSNAWLSLDSKLSGTFMPGKGYGLIRTSDGRVAFTGSPYNSDAQLSLTNLSSSATNTNGWNLIGNPWPSAIRARGTPESFLEKFREELDPSYQALYLADGSGFGAITLHSGMMGDLYPLDPAGYLQAGQGFFVKAKPMGGIVRLEKQMQTHATSIPLMGRMNTGVWPGVRLTAGDGTLSQSTVVNFNGEMTTRLDPSFDIGMLSSRSGLDLYTRLVENNGVNFMIQALPDFNLEQMAVPVGLNYDLGGQITFSGEVVPLPGDYKIYLEDRETGTLTNLATDTYTVEMQANTRSIGRFYLRISQLTDVPEAGFSDPEIDIRVIAGQLVISGLHGADARARVVDLAGRTVAEYQFSGSYEQSVTLPVLQRGIYLVEVVEEGRRFVGKIVR